MRDRERAYVARERGFMAGRCLGVARCNSRLWSREGVERETGGKTRWGFLFGWSFGQLEEAECGREGHDGFGLVMDSWLYSVQLLGGHRWLTLGGCATDYG